MNSHHNIFEYLLKVRLSILDDARFDLRMKYMNTLIFREVLRFQENKPGP